MWTRRLRQDRRRSHSGLSKRSLLSKPQRKVARSKATSPTKKIIASIVTSLSRPARQAALCDLTERAGEGRPAILVATIYYFTYFTPRRDKLLRSPQRCSR